MFKLSNYFVKQQEAEAESASAGSEEATDANSGDQTVLTEEQDNTESEGDTTDTDNTEEESDDKAEDDKGESEEESDSEAPEKYDFQVPEGMELDEALAEKFTDVAKDLGLNNEQANKLVGLYAEQVEKINTHNKEAWDAQVSNWADELKADPDFGGANFDKNAEIARIAVNKFGDDDLKKALSDTGLGNHPALVKFMHKIGTAISEDSFSMQEEPGSKESTAQGLYSKSNMNP